MNCLLQLILTILAIILIWIIIVFVFFRKEIRAATERDPAAKNYLEIILLYSGYTRLFFIELQIFCLS